MVLFSVYRALLQKNMALFSVYMALLQIHMALFSVYRALLPCVTLCMLGSQLKLLSKIRVQLTFENFSRFPSLVVFTYGTKLLLSPPEHSQKVNSLLNLLHTHLHTHAHNHESS